MRRPESAQGPQRLVRCCGRVGLLSHLDLQFFFGRLAATATPSKTTVSTTGAMIDATALNHAKVRALPKPWSTDLPQRNKPNATGPHISV